jgi:aminopeptidase-like protein
MTAGGIDAAALPSREALGKELHALLTGLFPLHRSITGDGVRQTFAVMREVAPLEVTEVPTGTQLYDWVVPREWNVRDAYVADPSGDRVIDFRASNLHLLSGSVPVRATMSLAELRPHLYTDPEHPAWIPWRTSYHDENWGFCLAHEQLAALPDQVYEVCIESTLASGSLTYAECVIPGASDDEILISSNSCHPSLANDSLSGMVVAVTLAKYLHSMQLRHTVRFLFSPGTLGPLAWLATNESTLRHVSAGLVATCLGDAGRFTYKRSRGGTAAVDRAALCVLRDSGNDFEVEDFVPWGGDERQFCSPGFHLPVGCLTRSPHGTYPEYHTSADNLDFVKPWALADSLLTYAAVLDTLDTNATFVNLNPKGEPQLGRRGLYPSVSAGLPGADVMRARLWMLNLSDGRHSLLDVAARSGLPFASLRCAARELETAGLLRRVEVGEQ